MKYLIEFTPIGSFAFSGENSFTNPGEAASRRTSYLVDSEFMPPQTTILGTLRRCVLEWDKIYRYDRKYDDKELASTIGKQAFSLTSDSFSLGKIKSISGAFLTRRKGEKTHHLFPAPNNAAPIKDDFDGKTYKPMYWDARKRAADERAMMDYDVKSGLHSGFVAISADLTELATDLSAFVATHIDGAEFISADSIFQKASQVAIRQTNSEDDKGFRIHYRVYFSQKKYSFAIVADLDNVTPAHPLLVSMGARNSLFRVTATCLPEIAKSQAGANVSCCMALLSPTKLPEDWRSMVDFAIVGRQKIRQMKRNADYTYRHDSTLRFFASAGSVFYLKPAQKETFIASICNQSALRKAGFNQYIMLNEEEKQ